MVIVELKPNHYQSEVEYSEIRDQNKNGVSDQSRGNI